MSDPPREGTDRFHFLGLAQLLLGATQASTRLPLCRRIERDDANAVGHRHHAQVEPTRRAVGKQELDFRHLTRTFQHCASQHREERLCIESRVAFEHGPPQELFAREPALPHQGVVHVQVAPIETDDLAALL